MNDDIKNFVKIQQFVKKEAEDAARKVYNELGTKYNVAQVPTHTHNGIDSVQVAEPNIVKGNRNLSGFTFDTSETVTFIGLTLPNFSRMSLFGFAANNADASPATKRAIVNGEAQFGRCFTFSGAGSGIVPVETLPKGDPIIQISNAMYVDSADLTKNRVQISDENIVLVKDDTGTIVASLTINSYTANSITVTSVVDTNWKVQTNFIFT